MFKRGRALFGVKALRRLMETQFCELQNPFEIVIAFLIVCRYKLLHCVPQVISFVFTVG
jgi:hypothetical protein